MHVHEMEWLLFLLNMDEHPWDISFGIKIFGQVLLGQWNVFFFSLSRNKNAVLAVIAVYIPY